MNLSASLECTAVIDTIPSIILPRTAYPVTVPGAKEQQSFRPLHALPGCVCRVWRVSTPVLNDPPCVCSALNHFQVHPWLLFSSTEYIPLQVGCPDAK